MGPGDILDGKYRIEAELGAGGMGKVFAATHLKLETSVAIKVLHADALALDHGAQRFLREARAASRLESKHVGRVFDVDQLPSGEPYMVMELLRGADLHRILQDRGPLRPDEAADFILQTCEALGEAHGHGMV